MALVGFVARDVADVTLQHAVHRLVCRRCHVYCTENEHNNFLYFPPNFLTRSVILYQIYKFLWRIKVLGKLILGRRYLGTDEQRKSMCVYRQ